MKEKRLIRLRLRHLNQIKISVNEFMQAKNKYEKKVNEINKKYAKLIDYLG